MISAPACQHWQPDRQLIPAQRSRSYTTRRDTAQARRGYHRTAGLRTGVVPRHPACAPQAVVPLVRDDHPGPGAPPADPPRTGWRRTARARVGQQNNATTCRCTGKPRPTRARIIDLSRSTVADRWARAHACCGASSHADDTVVPMLEPGLGRTRTARLWVYVRDDRPFAGPDPAAVFYRYTPDRNGEHPRAHLSEFRGILQIDGYAGFASSTAATGSSKLHVSPIRDEYSGTCTRRPNRRLPARRWTASARCIRSRAQSAADHPISAEPFASRIRRS